MAPIHDAARAGDVDSLRMILDSHPGVIDNPDSRLGWTAIHTAVIRGRTDVVKLLVQRGADVDKGNYNFLTPLFSAVSNHRKYEIIHALVVDGGANVLKLSNNAETILQVAEKQECEKSVLKLLQTHVEKAEAERAAKNAAEKKKRAEAAAKRKAEREANGGVAAKRKKKAKAKKSPTKKPRSPPEEGATGETGERNESNPTSSEGQEESKANDEEASPTSGNDVAAPQEEGAGDSNEGDPDGVENKEETNDPVSFLQADNREVIGAVELMLVKGTIVVRQASVEEYSQEVLPNDEEGQHSKVVEAAAKLTKQLSAWNPDQPAFGFFVPPDEVQAGRDELEQAQAHVHDKPSTGAVMAHGLLGVKDDGNRMEVRIKPVAHTRNTAWTNRYYYQSGRVQSKTLSKIKAATNILKAQTTKGTIAEVKFYTEDRAWYWPTVLLVGESKKVPGGLFGIKFDCIDQEHLHHGR